MTQLVRAYGQILRFPKEMSDDAISKAILDNEPKLNPDYKPPASSNIKNIAKEYLGVDVDQLSKKMSDSRKSIADRAEESATRGENAAAPQVPGAPVRQSTYNSALLNDRFGIKPQDNLDQSGILGRISKTADEDIRGQGFQANLRGAITDAPPPVPSGLTGLAKNVLTGAKQTGRMIGSTVDVAKNDLLGVEDYAKESGIAAELNTPIEQRKLNEQFKQIDRDQGLLGKIGDTVSAARQNPMGMGQLVAEQLPNTGVLIGGSYAGFKTGALAGAVFGPVGATIGGALGLVGGMFLGNSLVEVGGKAIEKASDEDGFTPQEREETINEGLKKSAVLTGVDLATLKIGGMLARSIGRPAINAGARAETKVLIDSGVDATSLTAINAALRSSPELFKKARMAGESAAIQSLSTGRKAAILGSVATLETIGEGVGEYAGEQYATGKGDVVDATIEALSSATMSLAETAYNYHKVASGNDLSAKGIQKAASNINDHEIKSGIDAIRKSKSVDEAIKAANESTSRKTITRDDVLRTIDPTLADIERLTGLKPSESIEQAINQAQQGLSPESIPAQGQQANVAPNVDVVAQKKPVSQNDINEYTQLINDVEARKISSPDTWTESDEKMLSLAKEKLNSITQPKGTIYEEETSQTPSTKKSAGVLGSSTEIVLPDNTTLPAQWEIVSADNIKATIKDGVNQPRDRTRASSDIQIKEISNNLDYRRLSDSPVMDVGAPTISRDGVIVAGHGRFEAVSLAHDKGTASDYLSALKNDAVNKGIDPAVIESMKKPVLVRRITQPYDTRKLAIDSNAGTSLQYSGMELAKIDAERMKGIEDLDITDAGDIALTGSNISKLKQSLGDYNNTELASLVDKNGALSQDGVRRVRNSLLAKAYGDSDTLGRLVESTDNDSRNVLGALTRSAGVVAKVRSDIEAGALPKELDITNSLLDAVETLSQIRSKGQPLEQYLAQDNLFGDDIDADSKEILKFLHDNIRSQKKLTEFIKDVYGQISSIDQSTEDIFGDNVIPSKQDVIQNAKQSTAGQAAEQQDIFAKQPSTTTEQAAKTKASDVESSKKAQPDTGLKFSRPPEERIKDRERSKQLESKLREQGYNFTIQAKDVRDFAAMDRGRQNEAVAAEQIAKNFGKRIVWIEAIGDSEINGVMIPSIKDTIFIDVTTDKYARAVMGHELSHHMERDNPVLYRDLVDSLENLIKDHDEYADKYGIEGEDKGYITKEIVGDIMGDNFTDQKFWNKVTEYNPSAFREIADKIISWLKNLVIKAKSRGLGSEQWVTDAQEAQDIIARAVAKYTNKKSSLDGLTNKVMFQKAWHGSPYDHTGFDSSKIGTGEGVQAYGYGHYFSDSKDVAEWYKEKLSSDENSGGKLYEVELAPSQDEYLLWDAALSGQSDKVRDALRGKLTANGVDILSGAKQNGEDLYKLISQKLDGGKEASKFLHKLGIRGIKYLDGSNRHEAYEVILSTKKGKYSSSKFESKDQAEQYAKAKREEGFSAKVRFNENANFNYVIFDDKDVSITAKFSRSKGWGDFPNAVIGQRSASDHKDYQAAKDGDFVAAVRLAEDTVTPGYLANIKDVVGNSNPIVVPIRSAEKTGSANAIPEAIGMQIASKLNIDFDENGIQQMERVGRTGSDGWHRIANQPSFEGDVERNRDYVIVDDTLAQGGTVAQLKEYIENNGGKVSLITALTGKKYSAKIGLSVSTLQLLRDKHGSIESWFRKSFGYGFEGLTESEARFIISAKGLSSEQVRAKIAEAKRDGADSNVQEDAKFSIAPPDESDAKFSKAEQLIIEQQPLNFGRLNLDYGDIEQRPGTTSKQRSEGGNAYQALLERIADRVDAKILGLAIAKDFKEQGGTNLIGQQVRTPDDLATVAQILRDPRYETFRVIYVKDNKVIHHTGVTSRLPGMVNVASKMKGESESDAVDRFIGTIAKQKETSGADGYYLLHNHPSGRATPSQGDKNVTIKIANEVHGFISHIVINSNEYSVIHNNGDSEVFLKELSGGYGSDALIPHNVLQGRVINSPSVMAEIGKTLQRKDGFFTLLGLSAQNKISSISEIPLSVLDKDKIRLIALLRSFARNSGAVSMAAVTDPGAAMKFTDAVESGALLDVVDTDGNSLRLNDSVKDPTDTLFRNKDRDRSGIRVEQDSIPGIIKINEKSLSQLADAIARRHKANKISESKGSRYYSLPDGRELRVSDHEFPRKHGGGVTHIDIVYDKENDSVDIFHNEVRTGIVTKELSYRSLNLRGGNIGGLEGFNYDIDAWENAVTRAIDDAIGNTGAFSSESDDIKFSKAEKLYSINIDGDERPRLNSNGKPIASSDEALRNFWEWFSDSAVVDEQGRPIVVYHGTNNSFDSFSPEKLGNATGAKSAKMGYFFAGNPSTSGAYIDLYRKTDEAAQAGNTLDSSLEARLKTNYDNKLSAYNSGIEQYLSEFKNNYKGNRNKSGSIPQKEIKDADLLFKKLVGLNKAAEELSDMYRSASIAQQKAILNVHDNPYTGANIMPVFLSLKNPLIHDYQGKDWREVRYSEIIKKAIDSGHDSLILRNTYDGAELDSIYIAFDPNQIKSAIGNTGAFSSESDDIKFSKAEKQREPLIPESKFRKFQRFWQDDFNRFIAMKEWLADRGINLSEKADVSRAEERYHSKVANQIEDFNDFVARPLIEKIAKAGFAMSDVADYLEAQHAEEANAAIAKLHKDPSMTAYGITNDEAEDYLSKAPKELGVLANEFRNITEQTKKLLLDNGLRSQEEIDAWEAAYKHYIPVKGGDKPTKGTGKGLAVNSKTKRRLGHGRRDEAVIENILLDHNRAIIEIEKNRIAKHLGMMSAEIAMPKLMTIGQPVKRKALKNAVAYVVVSDGLILGVTQTKEAATVMRASIANLAKKEMKDVFIEETRDQRIISSASPMLAENEINMYIDGHAIRIQINDEIAARAYKHLGIEGYGHLVAAGRAINGYLSKAYTGYAPEWGISNIIRDFTAGIINLTGEEGIVMAAKAVKNYPGSFASLLGYAFTGRKQSNKWIDMYRANGGNTGAAWLPDMERLSNDVASEYAAFQGVVSNLKQGDMANASRAALRKLHNVFLKWLNNLNQASENAMRLAAFRAMIESGKSVNEASHISKNITINFNKKGEFGQTANAAYLFFNATMNGQAAMNHALFKGKHKYQAWALGGAGLTALGYTMAAMLGGGDEDEYDKLDDYTKERNMVIKSGDGWIKIPVPYGHGFFWSLGRAIADAQRKDELGTLPWHIASSAIEELTPLGGIVVGSDEEFKSDQVFLGLLPTVAQIAVQPALNRSIFSGGEMMPESPFDQSQPDRDKMWRGTKGTIYDKVAGWLEDAGVTDISPETLKHLTRSATGGAGSTLDAVISSIMLKTQGAELDANEMPFARKLYHENTIRSDRAAFQKARGEARTAAEEFRRANRDNDLVSIDKILKDKHEMIMLDNYANKLQKFINIERDEQDAVRTNESIPIAERRLKLKELEAKEAKFYNEYLDVFKIDKSVMKERLR